VLNRGIKQEPADAAEELRLDRLSFSDVPPLAMKLASFIEGVRPRREQRRP
jgi:hypothetical protein